MTSDTVNSDLKREREKCTFDVEEMTHIIDGGAHKTHQRRSIETRILSIPGLQDPVPEEHLGYKERYESAVRKTVAMTSALREIVLEYSDVFKYSPTNSFRAAGAMVKDVSPVTLHFGMFMPTLFGQASPEQLDRWLARTLNVQIIGTYAQTEMGHGTFLRGLETTSTYDQETKEFVLNTPTLTAYKWWPGGLGHTANHCIVVAQLYTKGKCHGVHPFLIQIRDEETHEPLPGIHVGDIGPKMGFQTANNGFLGFKNFRVPRDAMLMKNAQVLEDGTYVKRGHEKQAYGTMVLVRVLIVTDVAFYVSVAATVAVRYSAVRRQSKPRPDLPEPQILDYVTQQQKLFIAVATAHALRVTGLWLWDAYTSVTKQVNTGNTEQLPELHALACCLKAVSTRDAATCVEQCRLACGGHGYMTSSNLPIVYALVAAACTYEGENTVMHLQTARFLVKACQQARAGGPVPSTLQYLTRSGRAPWTGDPASVVRGLEDVAAGRIRSSVDALESYAKTGMAYEDAWNLASVQLVAASEAHCRAVLCRVFWQQSARLQQTASRALGAVLALLTRLYLVHWALQTTGDLLLYSNISGADLDDLREQYEELLQTLRPNAVGLVDAFDHRDEVLNSTLGAYDGRVYERLMAEALKSPLNAESVNRSFHTHLKPFMQGKL